MSTNSKRLTGRRLVAIAMIPVAALLSTPAGAIVGQPDGGARIARGSLDPAGLDLEKAFWMCDYLATVHGVEFTPVEVCVEVTAQFREKRFGGDYDRWVAWWRQNKETEHAKLQAMEAASVAATR